MSGKGKIKGYVVRGKANDAPVFYVGDGDFAYADVGDGEAPKTLNTIGDSLFAVESMGMDGCTDVRILAVAEDGTETPLPTYEDALAQLNLFTRLRAGELAEMERLRALLAKVFGGEAAEASLGQLVELAAAELAEIDDVVWEAGVEAQGPDDTLPARVGRLIEDANEVERGAESLDDVLTRIVAAWRDDEIGQLDGALVEEAEALLGITPEADPLAAEPTS